MTAMQRRVQARPPLSAADVVDRAQVRRDAEVRDSSYRNQLEHAIAERAERS